MENIMPYKIKLKSADDKSYMPSKGLTKVLLPSGKKIQEEDLKLLRTADKAHVWPDFDSIYKVYKSLAGRLGSATASFSNYDIVIIKQNGDELTQDFNQFITKNKGKILAKKSALRRGLVL
jgi:hypothetical protein